MRVRAARPASVTRRRWLTIEPEQYPPPWKYSSTREGSLPGTIDHSPATPSQSTASHFTSGATGQVDPTSSSRCRRSDQPTGRGFEPSNVRMASISLWATAASPDEAVHHGTSFVQCKNVTETSR